MLKTFSKYTLFLCFFSLFTAKTYAQQNFLVDADIAFDNREYFNAISLYKKAYAKERKNETKALIIFRTAECYRNIGDSPQAEVWYLKAIEAGYPDDKAVLYLADALKQQGKNDEAKTQYQKYKEKQPGDPRAEVGIKSSELCKEWISKPTRWKVDNVVMINTKDREFAPSFADNNYKKLYFTSTRAGTTGGEVDATIGEAYSDVFETTIDNNGKWSTPIPLDAPVTTKDNEGLTSITKKGDKLFWTRCIPEKNKIVYNQLWVVTKQEGDTKWDKAEKLPFNNDSMKFASPAISADGKILVFASNMPGGYGENDLWMSKYDEKSQTWSTPVNLGADVNTPGNDVFPYIKDDGTLFYSSNGRVGMGGLDIFKAEKTGENKWGKVENMKFPINSNSDDFGITFEGNLNRGYLSSNREGTKGSDDIWSFVLPPLLFAVEGKIVDAKWKEPVPGVTLVLTGSDGSKHEVKTDEKGVYVFEVTDTGERMVSENTKYTVTVAVDDKVTTARAPKGFLKTSSKYNFTTVGEKESKRFRGGSLDMAITPIEKEIQFPAVLYDVGKSTLRAESQDSLNYLYQTLIDNPEIVIELSAHTDSRGANPDNLRLSQARAQSCYDYLVSKGIPADRMVPKGYGEERLLITDKQINSLLTVEEKEAAHQKNRRTVFSVLRKDYGLKK